MGKTKTAEKGILIAAQWHIGTKAPTLNDLSIPGVFEAEKRRLPRRSCLSWEHLGKQVAGSCEGAPEFPLPVFFSLYAEKTVAYERGNGGTAGLARGDLVREIPELEEKCVKHLRKHRCILLLNERIYDK